MATIKDGSALFLYDCQSDDAVLSGGNWLPELPLSCLQSPRLERIARSVDASPASTRINIALRRPVDIAAIYIGWTSLTPLAKARVQFWPSSSFSGTPDFDGGWLEDLIPADDDADRGPSLYIMLDQSRTAQFVSIEIDDRFNLAGSIDLGRLIIGRYVKPSFNYSYDGNSFNFVSRAIVATTLSGDEMVWDRAEPRTFAMGFQYLPEAEVFADFYRMWRTIKRGGEVVVIPRPDAGALELQRRSFLGRAVNRDLIIQAMFERGHASLEIREVMGLAPISGTMGAVVLLPVDRMAIKDFAPSISTPVTVDLPVDAMLIDDFAPEFGTGGTVVSLPVDVMVTTDYGVSVGPGTIVELPCDALRIEDYVAIVRGFDTGFDMGFGGGGWSPAKLFANGEQGLFIDPSDLSTLFQNAAGTTPVTSDGDPVGLVLDKSGRGNHLSQATLASRPVYRTDGTLHWLEFDGVDDWLVTTAVLPITGTDEITVLVGQQHLVNSPDGCVLELSPTRATNTNAFTIFSPSNISRYLWAVRGSGVTSNVANAMSSTFDAPHTGVLSCLGKISPSDATLRVNGGQVGQGTTNTGAGNWGSYPLYIGRRGGASLPWKGRLYGLVVRNALTADPLLSAAEAYMATKTGVSW